MSPFRLLLLLVLLDMVAGSAMWPAFPEFVAGRTHPEVWIGIGTALFLGLQLVTAPLLGRLSDTWGRRPVLILSALGTVASTALLLPLRAWSYLSNRAADGLTNGVTAAIRSAVTDLSSQEDLQRNVGLEGTVAGLGFVIGPGLGALALYAASAAGLAYSNALVLVCFGLSISIIAVFCTLAMPETHPAAINGGKLRLPTAKELSSNILQALAIHQIWHRLRILVQANPEPGSLLRLVALQLCLTSCMGYYSYYIIYLSQGALQMDTRQISICFAYFGLVSAGVNFLFFTRFVGRVRSGLFIRVMSLIGIATHLAYAWIGSSLVGFYVIVTIDCLTLSLIPGVLEGLIAAHTQEETRGELLGLVQGLGGLASLATTVIYTLLSLGGITLPFYWFALCLLPLCLIRTEQTIPLEGT